MKALLTIGAIFAVSVLLLALYTVNSTRDRFIVSTSGVILDNNTGLEWIIGPDRDISYDNAVKWVSECKVAGGGWRMPMRQEPMALYLNSQGTTTSGLNIEPIFKTTGLFVWTEPRDSDTAYAFNFIFASGDEWTGRQRYDNFRVFGVRERKLN